MKHSEKSEARQLIVATAIAIQIGIGIEIDEKARNSTPIAISTVQMCHN